MFPMKLRPFGAHEREFTEDEFDHVILEDKKRVEEIEIHNPATTRAN